MYPNLKLQLWKTGMRQNRLATVLLIDETVLSKIINGFRQPNFDLKERIAKVLECDPEWLFEQAENHRVAADLKNRAAGSSKQSG
jgi:transcriptional regulator with XRE-family HTH domain